MKPKSPTRLVTNAFLPATGVRFLLEPERDEEVRAGADALPAEEGEQQVVAEHEHEHREHEQVQVDEELGEPRVAVHVADRVEVDQRADAGDEQDHRHRQRVEQEAEVDLEAAGRDPGEAACSVACARARSSSPTNDDDGDRRTTRAHHERGEPAGQRLADALAEEQEQRRTRPAAAPG